MGLVSKVVAAIFGPAYALVACVECSCGRSCEVVEGQKTTCRCGATLAIEVNRKYGLVSAVPQIHTPQGYPWGELHPVVFKLFYKPVKVRAD